MAFEAIIRPFTAPNPLGTRRIPIIVEQVSDADGIISWGEAGDIVQPQEVVPASEGGSDGGGGDSALIGPEFFGFQIKSCNTNSKETGRKAEVDPIHRSAPGIPILGQVFRHGADGRLAERP